MKTIKPQKLAILTRPFEHENECFLSIALLAFFPFDMASGLASEAEMWQFTARELGETVLDAGMNKMRGELLVSGKAFTVGARPYPAASVRVQLSTIDKSLLVVGDRHWDALGLASDFVPFTEMPITWQRAFGGEGFAQNPIGRGYAPVRTASGDVRPLPNIEDPRKPVDTPDDRPQPAGFGPYEFAWPQRFSKAGTYDGAWQKELMPGFAHDIDWTIFNAAPEDQWIEGYFRGDETFHIENMHPTQHEIDGRLPGIAARLFVNFDRDAPNLREVSTRVDTVWLFPHALKGVMIFRGLTRVSEDDAMDVQHLLAGFETLGEPRPVEHYLRVFDERIDKERGALAALRDDDLLPTTPNAVPAPSASDEMTELLAREGLLAQNLRRKIDAEQARARATMHASGAREPRPPRDAMTALTPIAPVAITADNLGALVQQARDEGARMRLQLHERRAAMEAESRLACARNGLDYDAIVARGSSEVGGPPRFSADAEVRQMHARAAEARAAGRPAPAVEAQLADGTLAARMGVAEQKMKEVYRRFAHAMAPAAASSAEASRSVRARVEAAVASRTSMAGWDLTGVDLASMNLERADLRRAFLERTNLSGCDLRHADLRDAVLARADLSHARMDEAQLAGANFGGAVLRDARATGGVDCTRTVFAKADFARADFTGATLSHADLSEARFENTVFRGVRAERVNFMSSDLTGLALSGSDFSRCNFLDCNVEAVDFSGANLTAAVFLDCRGSRANFRGAMLDKLRFVQACVFDGADFQEASLAGANLRGASLVGAKFSLAKMDGADLSGCDLRGAEFLRTVACEARFVRADLTDAIFIMANLMQGIVQKATITGADFTGANLFRADFARVRGAAKSLEGANIGQVRVITRGQHG